MNEYSEVARNLYVGSAPTANENFWWDFDKLVLAAEEWQPPSKDFPNVEVVHVPYKDTSTRMSRDQEGNILRVALRVSNWLKQGRRVLVSCWAGLNRSSLIAALAMMHAYGFSAEDAVLMIRSVRGPFAFRNSEFMRVLRSAEQRLQNQKNPC